MCQNFDAFSFVIPRLDPIQAGKVLGHSFVLRILALGACIRFSFGSKVLGQNLARGNKQKSAQTL